MLAPMGDILKLIWWAVIGLFRSKSSLEAEILTLLSVVRVFETLGVTDEGRLWPICV
jgi:hypothetical protein